MKKILLICLAISSFIISFAQTPQNIEFNKEYKDVFLNKTSDLTYKLKLSKGGVYQISVLQQGVDVVLILTDNANKKILDKDSPNGQFGYEKFEYSPVLTSTFFLKINRLEEAGNPDTGSVTVFIKSLTKEEIALKEKIRKELEPENKKNVLTLDIDHFWEAFDNLKTCKTHSDSVASFQKLYFDRATNGLIDFMSVRDFSAEKFTNVIAKFSKFYNSVRKNTYEVKKAAPLIEEVFLKFKELYPNFKPFKVCFAIGMLTSGGTVSNSFVLIGTEISTSTRDVDLSEFNNDAFSKILAGDNNIVQHLKNVIAHECVHTQQKQTTDSTGIRCDLLYAVMQEGFCDFIGELVAGKQINEVAQEYGNKHEKELWTAFKNELCSESTNNWLYNYGNVKDKPADLGYYIGYKIAQEYYKNSTDKKQAVVTLLK
jgi:predicted Zn-dependent protease DUF2268